MVDRTRLFATAFARSLLKAATAAAWRSLLGASGGREVLSANRTYYVGTDGSNSNTGLVDTAGGRFLTIQKAWDVIVTLDLAGFTATIQHAASQSPTTGLNAIVAPVGGPVVLDGGNCTFSVTSASAIILGTVAKLTIQNIKLQTVTSGNCLFVSGAGSYVVLGAGVIFGTAAGGSAHIRVSGGGYVIAATAYSITAVAAYHYQVILGGILEVSSFTVTSSGTYAYTTFAECSDGGEISAYGMTYTGGTITGKRYNAVLNAVINTYGGGANYFPGGTAGTTATGGAYA